MKYWAFSEKVRIEKVRNSWIEITEKYTFFLFPTVRIFYFCKNMNPRLYILFLVDKSVTQIMNMFWELLEAGIKCMIVFQELNCDPLKKVRNSRPEVYTVSYLYFNEESYYSEENVEMKSLLHHRKKLNIFTSQLLIYWCKCQKQSLEVLCEKKVLFKMSQNSQETPVPEETPMDFAKVLRTLFL